MAVKFLWRFPKTAEEKVVVDQASLSSRLLASVIQVAVISLNSKVKNVQDATDRSEKGQEVNAEGVNILIKFVRKMQLWHEI